VAKIDTGLGWAQRTGQLASFNAEYKAARLAAAARGESYPSYGVARAQLRAALADAATGQVPVTTIRDLLTPCRS
jgi:hypothetical protein